MFSVGCASWDDVMNTWVGNDIEKIVDLWGSPDEITKNEDGRDEYKYSGRSLGRTCTHYWLVSQQGVITGFRHKGYCQPN